MKARILAAESSGVARFAPSGALDDTFAGGGTAPTPKDTSQVFDILTEADGRIVIAGDAGGVDSRMFLGRLTAKGDMDTTFGSGGTAAPEFDGAGSPPPSRGGRTASCSWSARPWRGGVSMAVSRYDTKGAPDTSYGNAGRLTLALGFPAAAGDAAIRPDGRLVVAGAVDVGTNDPRPAIARLLATPPVQDPGPGGGAGPGGGDPGPGADPVTPTIPMCAGRPATIVGAARGETLRGTAGDDVIVTRGGADRVRAPSWSRHRLRRWRARRALRRPEWTETINRAAGTDPAPPERQTAPSPPSCTIPVIVSSSVRMPGRRRRQAARRTHALARRSRRPARQG